jgi:hypothetical protein
LTLAGATATLGGAAGSVWRAGMQAVDDPNRPQLTPAQTPPQMQTFGASSYPIAQPASGAAIASLVCGILGLLTGWIPFVGVVGLVLGIVAVVTGIIGVRRTNGRGMAIAGLVCGSLGAIFMVGYWVAK